MGNIENMFRKPLILAAARHYVRQQGGALLHLFCGDTPCGDVNADIVPRAAPNFILLDSKTPLPFEDGEFSAVFTSDVLEYSESPMEIVMELQRIADEAFIVIPKIWDLNYSSPKHRWLAVDKKGLKWIENPLWKIAANLSEKGNLISQWQNLLKNVLPSNWDEIKEKFRQSSSHFIQKLKNPNDEPESASESESGQEC